MYLAIMLIIVAILVFYNEINSKMNIAEIALLVITVIAIIRASMNYIQYNDTFKKIESKIESFTSSASSSGRRHRNARNASSKGKDNILNVMSENSKEYFDTDSETEIDNETETDAINNFKNIICVS